MIAPTDFDRQKDLAGFPSEPPTQTSPRENPHAGLRHDSPHRNALRRVWFEVVSPRDQPERMAEESDSERQT